jgi:glycosyltransferase involved in cell wall biosynthesis
MPVNSPAMRAALPHLSSDIRLIPRCADSMEFGYQRALTCRERIASIVATTPRHVEDLSGRYQVPVEQISLIPHGISSQPFDSLPSSDHARNGRVPLRLAFLGRLEHRQKGILFLPGILRRLQDEGIAYRLSVAGKGQHEQELKTGLEEAGVATHVQFVGALTPEEVPPFLHGHDVLLFPSQHEGFGFVLIEALMAGCIPVASRLPGVTDFIVQDGVTGMLCGIGDEASFANAISVLTANPERAQAIRLAARAEARERFSNEKLTIAYASLLRRWAESAPPIFEPRPWSAFNPPSDLRPSPVRNWLRSVKRRIVSHPFAKAR